MATVRRDSPCSIASLCGQEATTHNNLDVATKKNPKQGTRLGVWEFVASLRLLELGGGGRVEVPPGLA
jgi:hypothetical protein